MEGSQEIFYPGVYTTFYRNYRLLSYQIELSVSLTHVTDRGRIFIIKIYIYRLKI